MTEHPVLDTARAWLAQDRDPDTRNELEALIAAGDTDSLIERFDGRLLFGTAGIRGVLGAGSMRMNSVVVAQVTAGLADYVADHVEDAQNRGVVIGYDGRHKSKAFADESARVLLGKGFRVFLAADYVPTPVVAFAVTDRKAAAGIMITASHNPPEYNGYKVYWENGAQIIPPHDIGIQDVIAQVGPTNELELGDLDKSKSEGRLELIESELEERYLEGVLGLRLHPEVATKAPITVAYTPLHGVGNRFVEAALRRAGYERFHVEPSQKDPDGAFPTVRFPNPEEDGAMDRVLALATSVEADLVIANDPDTDRLAIALPDGDGYSMLTGDQVGVLLADYLLSEGPDGVRLVATTIVSSQLLGRMAAELGVSFRQTLTGFKWIANGAIEDKRANQSHFVVGYEEALGYTIGELVRDKDGVSAALLFAELASFAKSRGETVRERLESIYRRFGLYVTKQVSLTLPGSEGLATIQRLMRESRESPPRHIGDHEVADYEDLNAGDDDLPKADVLIFRLSGGNRVIVRPSGTEPKLKCYYEIREPMGDDDFAAAEARATARLEALAAAHQATLSAS